MEVDARLGDSEWAGCTESSSWEQISAEDVEVGTVLVEEMSSAPIFRNIWRERERESGEEREEVREWIK